MAKERWYVQVTPPDDFFQNSAFTVEQWLQTPGDPGAKWQVLVEVCALVEAELDTDDGFQNDGPRVGWSPTTGLTFIFKSQNDGTCCFVSEGRLLGLVEPELDPRPSPPKR